MSIDRNRSGRSRNSGQLVQHNGLLSSELELHNGLEMKHIVGQHSWYNVEQHELKLKIIKLESN